MAWICLRATGSRAGLSSLSSSTGSESAPVAFQSTSMKWRHLGHFQLLTRAVAIVGDMEASPQEEMANPQGMKVFDVERHRLQEEFVYFRPLYGVQSSPLVFAPNRPIV